MTHPVFVYGTLKRGHARDPFLRNQRHLGTALTEPNYKIYKYSSFPALIEVDQGKSIYGELYEVTESCLMELDEVEGTRQGLFARNTIHLKQINFTNLPLYKNSSDMLMSNLAIAYFFVDREKLLSLKDCGQNWTITEQ
jgi:gamma-glutamylcyclotransferase (GGCT)/AIG2-like uncharacterized protein YtfP